MVESLPLSGSDGDGCGYSTTRRQRDRTLLYGSHNLVPGYYDRIDRDGAHYTTPLPDTLPNIGFFSSALDTLQSLVEGCFTR